MARRSPTRRCSTPGSYSDTIVPGEVLTYQVDVDWGQRLTAEVDLPKPSAKLGSAIGNGDEMMSVAAYGPDRRATQATWVSGGPASEAVLFENKASFSASTVPIAYLNRTTSDGGADLAGPYTVTVFMEEDPDNESYLVPFTLHLGVTGDTTGEPSYTKEPAPVDSPSAEPTPGEEKSDDTSAASASTDDGGPGAGLLLGGLGVLALVAAGGLVVRSRAGGAG